MTVKLTRNFFFAARGMTYLDSGSVTWSFNPVTNELSATASGSGGSSPLTTKGDLYGFSTVAARVPAGANGTVLTADSTAAAGVSYKAAATGNITPDTHPASPTIYDDEFESGSTIDLSGTRSSGASPWVWNNQLGASGAVSQGSLVLLSPGAGGNSYNMVLQPITGTDWEYTTSVSIAQAGTFAGAGLCVLEPVSGKIQSVSVFSDSPPQLLTQSMTNSTTFSANTNVGTGKGIPTYSGFGGEQSGKVYLRIGYATLTNNISFQYSASGVNGTYNTIITQTPAIFLGAAPTKVGLYVNAGGNGSAGTTGAGVFDWFRKTL